MITTKLRFGFKGKKQVPLFMIWREEFFDKEITYAYVIFDSRKWIGF